MATLLPGPALAQADPRSPEPTSPPSIPIDTIPDATHTDDEPTGEDVAPVGDPLPGLSRPSPAAPFPSTSPVPDPVGGSGPNAPTQTVDGQPQPGPAGVSSAYRLGIGDVVKVDVFGAEEYGGQFIVLQDGTINVPRIGQVFVLGFTFAETESAVAGRYLRFLNQPIVTVSPVTLRPVRVAVAGEVRRPGSYTIQRATETGNTNDFDDRFPTLTEAISQAGGITSQANISEVTLRRPVSHNEFQVTTYNLWDLIQSGDLSNDIVLQSGDEITIPTAVSVTPEEATEVSGANFAPDAIIVYVAGEVARPGEIEVPLNTPLNQALLNAGGFNNRANRATVDLVRLNPDGTALEQQIDVDLSQGINDENNPILKDRDVVVVNRSGLARVGDATDILLSPVTRVLNTILGLQRLFD
ncbi:MAG: SLBB domain-containing protein [Nodosilinea sp.]